MANTGDWQGQYVVWPDTDVYPDASLYPDNVHRVTGNEEVWSKDSKWRWEKVTDTSSIERMIQTTHALQETIRSIPTSLDMVVGVADGKVVNATVVQQLFARYVTAEDGEFVKLTAGQIAANAIGANQIKAGAIDGMVITGSTIKTNSGTAHVELTPSGLYALDANNNITFRVNSNTGEVWARGNFGVTDSWCESYFGDVSDTYRVTYAGGSQLVYAGCGMRFMPQKLPSNTRTSVAMADFGSIFASYRAINASDKNDAYKGQVSSTGVYGLALQSPRRSAFSQSVLLVEEGGLTYSNRSGNNPFYFAVAPQRFTAYSPQSSAGYRFVVEGGADSCFWVWGNESSGRRSYEFAMYTNSWSMSNLRAKFVSVTNPPYGVFLDTGITYSETSSNRARLMVQGSSSGSVGFEYRWGTTPKLQAAAGGAAVLLVNQSMLQFKPSGGSASSGFFVNTTTMWCSGITKNFVMQVPEMTRERGMLLQHTATESPTSGIEYWQTIALDENGQGTWVLPSYVEKIASPTVTRSVFVTCSTGTAAATLVCQEGAWRVEVSEGTPGATANILVKLARVIDNADDVDGDGFVQSWRDNAYDVWTPLMPTEDNREVTGLGAEPSPQPAGEDADDEDDTP